MYSYNPSQYPSGYDDAPNQISAGKGKEQMAMELPPEVQQAVARYLQGFNAPTPMSSSDRIDITVPSSENKATSYMASPTNPFAPQADPMVSNQQRQGIQMSSAYSIPSTSPMELPMNAPTPMDYLGGDFENSVYLPYYS